MKIACAYHTSDPVHPSDSASSTGRWPYCSTQYFSSSAVSHRCVCKCTCSCLRASSALARISSRRHRERRARRDDDPRHRVARRVVVLADHALGVAQDRVFFFDGLVGRQPALGAAARHRAARSVEAKAHLARDRDLVVDPRAVRPDVAVIGGRRAAGEQQLRDGGGGARAHGLGGQPRPDRVMRDEPVEQPGVLRLRKIARERLEEVVVRADQPRQQHEAARIDDLVGLRGQLARRPDRFDDVAAQQHRAVGDLPLGVVERRDQRRVTEKQRANRRCPVMMTSIAALNAADRATFVAAVGFAFEALAVDRRSSVGAPAVRRPRGLACGAGGGRRSVAVRTQDRADRRASRPGRPCRARRPADRRVARRAGRGRARPAHGRGDRALRRRQRRLPRAVRLSVRDLRARARFGLDSRRARTARAERARRRGRDWRSARSRRSRGCVCRTRWPRERPYVLEWLNLIARWAHLIAGISWIGASFYFVWLDDSLDRSEEPGRRAARDVRRAVVGARRRLLSQPQVPHGPARRAAHAKTCTGSSGRRTRRG